MWIHQTDTGTFKIVPTSDGRFDLFIDDTKLENFHSPSQAAHVVAMCMSGHWPWDKQLTVDHPASLNDWKVVT